MNRQDIELAISESKRFIEKAEYALTFSNEVDHKHFFGNGSANAAMKRSSLDASKALSAMRNSKD